MTNTYTQIHLQFIFAVQDRISLIDSLKKDELYKYMSGIVQQNNHKLLIVNGMPDHIQMLVEMRPTQSVADLLQDIKGSSSKWINNKNFIRSKFSWQEGSGAFSYSKSQLNTVINYIENQEQHHQKRTFLQEYKECLEKFEVPDDESHLFKEAI
jgi:REP element-mobilizing transposase RayT